MLDTSHVRNSIFTFGSLMEMLEVFRSQARTIIDEHLKLEFTLGPSGKVQMEARLNIGEWLGSAMSTCP